MYNNGTREDFSVSKNCIKGGGGKVFPSLRKANVEPIVSYWKERFSHWKFRVNKRKGRERNQITSLFSPSQQHENLALNSFFPFSIFKYKSQAFFLLFLSTKYDNDLCAWCESLFFSLNNAQRFRLQICWVPWHSYRFSLTLNRDY